MKYRKTYFQPFSCKDYKKMQQAFLKADQNRAIKCCPMGWIDRPILMVAQKDIVRFQFLHSCVLIGKTISGMYSMTPKTYCDIYSLQNRLFLSH